MYILSYMYISMRSLDLIALLDLVISIARGGEGGGRAEQAWGGRGGGDVRWGPQVLGMEN